MNNETEGPSAGPLPDPPFQQATGPLDLDTLSDTFLSNRAGNGAESILQSSILYPQADQQVSLVAVQSRGYLAPLDANAATIENDSAQLVAPPAKPSAKKGGGHATPRGDKKQVGSCLRRRRFVDPNAISNVQLNHYNFATARNNFVSTTKYKWYTFIFKFLFEQYQRPQNVFYLVVLIVNSIPGLRVVGLGVLLLPIIFVLLMSAIREIIEDVSRAKSDKQSNMAPYTVIRASELHLVRSYEIRQGDIIVLRSEEEVPVDSLLIYSSNASKIAYMNTASLDGESNLKPRRALTPYFLGEQYTGDVERLVHQYFGSFWGRASLYAPSSDLSQFTGKCRFRVSLPLSCLPPESSAGGRRRHGVARLATTPAGAPYDHLAAHCSTASLSDDEPALEFTHMTRRRARPHSSELTHIDILSTFRDHQSACIADAQDADVTPEVSLNNDGKTFTFSKLVHFHTDNTLYRGMRMQNTAFALAAALYTGVDTKLMLNQTKQRPKISRLQRRLDRIVLFNVTMLVVGLIVCAIMGETHKAQYRQRFPYAGFNSDGSGVTFFLLALSFLVLFSYSMPISLFVSLEIVRLVQGVLIDMDANMRRKHLVARLLRSSPDPLPANKVHVTCKASMLIEDLAEVDIIFSDKTGTITANAMVFHSYFTFLDGIKCCYGRMQRLAPAKDAGGASSGAAGAKDACASPDRRQQQQLAQNHAASQYLGQEQDQPVGMDVGQGHSQSNGFLETLGAPGVSGTLGTLGASASALPHPTQRENEAQLSTLMMFPMALCNNVITQKQNGQTLFQGDSPDEVAFVRAAAEYGLRLCERNADEVVYEFPLDLGFESACGQDLVVTVTYRVLAMVPFTSTRKKMSIVLQEVGTVVPPEARKAIRRQLARMQASQQPQGQPLQQHCGQPVRLTNFYVESADVGVGAGASASASASDDALRVFFTPTLLQPVLGEPFILTKGADSFILPLCNKINGRHAHECEVIVTTTDNFSSEGLRTLAWAVRALPAALLAPWLQRWSVVSNRQEADAEYTAVSMEIETELNFVGITAIEDKLQDEVPATLASFSRAGVKVWLLTGDKTLTAVNIAKSSNLSSFGNEWFYLTADEVQRCAAMYRNGLMFLEDAHGARDARDALTQEQYDILDFAQAHAQEPAYQRVRALAQGARSEDLLARMVAVSFLVHRCAGRIDECLAQCGHTVRLPSGHRDRGKCYNVYAKIINVFSLRELYQQKILYKITGAKAVARAGAGAGAGANADANADTAPGAGKRPQGFTLVLDSDTFKVLGRVPTTVRQFLHVALHSSAVVACRLSPEEKATVVHMVRTYDPMLTTLAIGDGANDCSMIKTANIGVGIAGNEGLHAANSADFSLPEFKYLKRLLFVHGRYTHIRNAELIEYSIYKNFILVIVNGIYSYQNLFSAQIAFNDVLIMMYNTFLTFLPIFFYAIGEKDVKDRILTSHPSCYLRFEGKSYVNFRRLALLLLNGTWHGVVCCLVPVYVLGGYRSGGGGGGGAAASGGSSAVPSGHTADITIFGYYAMTATVFIATFKLCLHTRWWFYAFFVCLLISFALYLVIVLVISFSTRLNFLLYGVLQYTFPSRHFWLAMFAMTAGALLPDALCYSVGEWYAGKSAFIVDDEYRSVKRLSIDSLREGITDRCVGRIFTANRILRDKMRYISHKDMLKRLFAPLSAEAPLPSTFEADSDKRVLVRGWAAKDLNLRAKWDECLRRVNDKIQRQNDAAVRHIADTISYERKSLRFNTPVMVDTR